MTSPEQPDTPQILWAHHSRRIVIPFPERHLACTQATITAVRPHGAQGPTYLGAFSSSHNGRHTHLHPGSGHFHILKMAARSGSNDASRLHGTNGTHTTTVTSVDPHSTLHSYKRHSLTVCTAGCWLQGGVNFLTNKGLAFPARWTWVTVLHKFLLRQHMASQDMVKHLFCRGWGRGSGLGGHKT